MILINLNGPAKCGKDALCQEIFQYVNTPGYEVIHMEFKELLFDIAIRASGVSRKLWFALYEREYKEKPCPYLQINGVNVSPRDWMIHCSENIMKPTFGEDVFGKAFAAKLQKVKDETPKGIKRIVVVSDGGFIEESIPVIEVAGPDNYFLCRIHRLKEDGSEYNFDGDSRRYIHAEEFPKHLRPYETDILNEEGDLRGTVEKIFDFVEDIKEDGLNAE
jgi:hypothetical protein